jgi:hypothetical protein
MRRVVAAWDARTWAKEILSDVCNDATARRVASPVRRYSLRNSARALDSLPSASSARNM